MIKFYNLSIHFLTFLFQVTFLPKRHREVETREVRHAYPIQYIRIASRHKNFCTNEVKKNELYKKSPLTGAFTAYFRVFQALPIIINITN